MNPIKPYMNEVGATIGLRAMPCDLRLIKWWSHASQASIHYMTRPCRSRLRGHGQTSGSCKSTDVSILLIATCIRIIRFAPSDANQATMKGSSLVFQGDMICSNSSPWIWLVGRCTAWVNRWASKYQPTKHQFLAKLLAFSCEVFNRFMIDLLDLNWGWKFHEMLRFYKFTTQ